MPYEGLIIDTDVHHSWHSPADFWPYLDKPWRQLATGELGAAIATNSPYRTTFRPMHGGGMRQESYPADGGRPCSDYNLLRKQLLDKFNFERTVLTHDSGRNNNLPNPYFAQAVVRAINDWTIDRWLGRGDKRLYSTMIIPGQFIDEAVAEIHRVGSNPRIVGAIMGWNSAAKPLGHQIYHPIYQAAAEMDLPIVIHINACEQSYGPAQMGGGGMPGSFYEYFSDFMQPMRHHLTSFIVHGVFEKFPTLKLYCIEAGITWVPGLFWQLDDNYRILKRESPLLKRLPSEYLREHVRFSTQPLEESPQRDQFIDVLEAFGGFDDLLCYSSDYPHWDSDDPRNVAARLPHPWHKKIFYENALNLFRWDRTPAKAEERREVLTGVGAGG